MFFFFANGARVSSKIGDVVDAPVDVLILKYADGLRGADLAVAKRLGLNETDIDLAPGEHLFVETRKKIAAGEVLFLGVGRLGNFDYGPIQEFATRAVDIVARERPSAKKLGITLHGPGYGLDELASIDSLVSGLTSISTAGTLLNIDVSIIERDPRRAARIEEFLGHTKTSAITASPNEREIFTPEGAKAISSSGTYERRLFAAMPFKSDYLDHWELALQPAAHENGLPIERLDHEHFTGDIVAEIRDRIEKATAVVAVLDENNPNVFLEVGYAWGKNRPAILLLKDGHEPPFDVRSQKLLRYSRLGELKKSLSKELQGLLKNSTI